MTLDLRAMGICFGVMAQGMGYLMGDKVMIFAGLVIILVHAYKGKK